MENTSVTEGCEIFGTVKNSVLGENVRVEAGATVEDSVLMGDSVVKAGARVDYAILDRNVEIGEGAAGHFLQPQHPHRGMLHLPDARCGRGHCGAG